MNEIDWYESELHIVLLHECAIDLFVDKSLAPTQHNRLQKDFHSFTERNFMFRFYFFDKIEKI